MQIAITLPDDELDEIDRMVPSEFRSRAEVVRAAVKVWLEERHASAVDALYESAYAQYPQHDDDIDSGRARQAVAHPWDDLEW